MKAILLTSLALAALTVSGAVLHSSDKASIGEVTPSWSATDTVGKTEDITHYRGKFVVLEWTNPECPFVQKHYGSGNMQSTQKKAEAMGAVWLSIDSTATGKSGYMTTAQANTLRKDWKINSTATILDSEGTVGRIYSAKATPQIVIINPKGVVIYNGAIDNKPTADASDIPGAKNYALTNLKLAMEGKPVEEPTTQPYGCHIQYAN
jgi:hypothetical protein